MTDSITNPSLEADENTDTFPTLNEAIFQSSGNEARLDHLQETIDLPWGNLSNKRRTIAEADENSSQEFINIFPSQEEIDAKERQNKDENDITQLTDIEILANQIEAPIDWVEKNQNQAEWMLSRNRKDEFLKKNRRVKEYLIANGIFDYTLADLHEIERILPEEEEGSIVSIPTDVERAEAFLFNYIIGRAENIQDVNQLLLKVKDSVLGKGPKITEADQAFLNIKEKLEKFKNVTNDKIPNSVNKITESNKGPEPNMDESLEEFAKSLGFPSFKGKKKTSKKDKKHIIEKIFDFIGKRVLKKAIPELKEKFNFKDPFDDKRFNVQSENLETKNSFGDPVVDFLNNDKKNKSKKDDTHIIFQKNSPAINSHSNESEVDRPQKSKKKK